MHFETVVGGLYKTLIFTVSLSIEVLIGLKETHLVLSKHFLMLFELLLLPYQAILKHEKTLASVVILELQLLKLVELSCSLFDDLSLLTNAQAFQVLEADSDLIVNVSGEPARRFQVVLPWLMVPVPFMILLVCRQNSQALQFWSLLELLSVEAPAMLVPVRLAFIH